MRILYSHYLTDRNHPAVRMVESIARELRLAGDVVHVHASDRSIERGFANEKLTGSASGVRKAKPSTSIVSRAKRMCWFLKRMAANKKRMEWDRQVIREFRPDVVLARQDAYCWSVVKAAKELNVPCVTYADAPVAYESRQFNDSQRWHPPKLVESIERWGLAQSEAVLTVSHPAAKRLRTYDLDQPIHVNPNGIDPCDFPELTDQRIRERKQALGLGDNVVIGFQGTFKSFHGIDRLRELILWSGTKEDVTWLLVGDGPERRQLEEAVAGKANVISLGRRQPNEMGELLALMDIAVAPHSQLEGDFYFCPLKILEYAASGCATLASNQGDIPMLLADGGAGEIIDDDKLSSWTDALEMLIDNDDYRAAFGDLARHHIHNNFTWKQTANRVRDVLTGIVEVAPTKRSTQRTTQRTTNSSAKSTSIEDTESSHEFANSQ